MALKVGDTVRLKSGGPLMTVTAYIERDGEPKVWCSWFEGTKEGKGYFPAAAVEQADD